MLEGDVPSKKNSRVITMRGGKVRSFPSKRYKEWEEYAIPKMKEGKVSFGGPVHIICKFWMGSNRRSDLDNRLASICDALKEAGVIEDDNWKVVKHIEGIAMGVEKNAPRVEIVIEELE